MTETPKPIEKHAESSRPAGPSETAVADSQDRGQLIDRQRAAKAYEENPARPSRLQVSGTFGKQDLSDVHIMGKGDNLQSVVEKRLGENATAEEVKAFMLETALLSGFKDPSEIKQGNAVQFPPMENFRTDPLAPQNPDGISLIKNGSIVDKPIDNTIIPPGNENVARVGGEDSNSFSDMEALSLAPLERSTPAEKNTTPTPHRVVAGENAETIARHELGPGASKQELEIYSVVLHTQNNLKDDAPLPIGRTLDLPRINADHSLTFTTTQDRDVILTVQSNGDMSAYNQKNGQSSFLHFTSEQGDYKQDFKGPKLEDNYTTYFDAKTQGLTTVRVMDGKITTTYPDGGLRVEDMGTGLIQITFADKSTRVIDPRDGSTMTHTRDGGTTVSYEAHPPNPDNTPERTEDFRPDGTKTTKWSHGVVLVENKTEGIGYQRVPTATGYIETGWGPNSKDDYTEIYDSTTHITRRFEAEGTADEKTTTFYPDGAQRVDLRDGIGYRRDPDGTEHHWGPEAKDNFVRVQDHQHLDLAKQNLEKVIHDHIPAAKQEIFKHDMETFETRLHDRQIAPEEAAKSYDQMIRLLTAPDSRSVVPADMRATAAVSLMHQLAYPEHTDQGQHNTCNVTTVAERLETREPCKAAEMVASVALSGRWTAPDGKTITIDKNSLRPGANESQYPPEKDGARSYATQLLNLTMANDVTQRRSPPEYYQQRTATNEVENDTGERLVDEHGNVIERKLIQKSGIVETPFDDPEISDTEIAQLGSRLMSDSNFFLGRTGESGAIDNFRSSQDLEDILQRVRDQREFPVIIQVSAFRVPIANVDRVNPENPNDNGVHVVSITNYDPVHHRVKISNQWGIANDRWVDAEALYENTLFVN